MSALLISMHLILSNLTSSHLMSCLLSVLHLISSHLISFHIISFHLISCLLSSSQLFSADHKCSHLFSAYLGSSLCSSSQLSILRSSCQLSFSQLFTALLMSGRLTSSHLISSHLRLSIQLFSAQLMSAHLMSSQLLSSLSDHLNYSSLAQNLLQNRISAPKPEQVRCWSLFENGKRQKQEKSSKTSRHNFGASISIRFARNKLQKTMKLEQQFTQPPQCDLQTGSCKRP